MIKELLKNCILNNKILKIIRKSYAHYGERKMLKKVKKSNNEL